jgi:DNA-binding transcriptional MocR family regulator
MTKIWSPKIERRSHAVYLDIVEALENDIVRGLLPRGARLPTHRFLADKLGVALGTITRAYREAQNRGLIRSDGKMGTFVNWATNYVEDAEGIFTSIPPTIDLVHSYPAPNIDPDPGDVLMEIAAYQNNKNLIRYTATEGCLPHRIAGAKWIAKHGLEVGPDKLISAHGAQHALGVILISIANQGDVIASDRLTYLGLKNSCRLLGLNLAAIESDDMGVLPDSFEDVCKRQNPKAIYLVPTLNNPTNTIIPAERRLQIAQIADKYGLYVIEDDIYRLLVDSPPDLFAKILPEKTILIASISKIIAGGLRVGYVLPPPSLASNISKAFCGMALAISPITQEIFTRWMTNGTVDKIITARKSDIMARQKIAREVFSDFTDYGESCSYNQWLHLPNNWTSVQLCAETQRRGVLVCPGEVFDVDDDPPYEAIRISLAAAANHEILRSALDTIADVLRGNPRSDQYSL